MLQTHKKACGWKQRQQFLASVKARKRQGMVSDFLDTKRQSLVDVKGCAFGTRYNWHALQPFEVLSDSDSDV